MLDQIKTSEAEAQDGPELFTGLRYELEEIIMGMTVLNSKTRDLKGCFDMRQEVSAKVTADDLCRIASQVSILAGHMSATITKHVNRKAFVK